MIPDSNSQDPLDELIRHGDYHVISDKIKLLDSREQKVMKTRFGLDGCKPSKLIEIADLLGMTKERVRQIGAIRDREIAQNVFCRARRKKVALAPLDSFVTKEDFLVCVCGSNRMFK